VQTSSRQRKINLALQGGGAHGAFTWGVLDRLLEDKRFDFGWISATSAGAVNAVALAAGLVTGGPDGARSKLKDVWSAVSRAGVPDLMQFNPFFRGLARASPMSQMASLWSPYDFNPLGFDPLRQLLNEHIDFKALRETEGPELLIAATDVSTGRARLFRRAEMSVEAVLASACLPTLHHAVEIDGAAYWDGGFSANPDLVTLSSESPVADTLLVKLNPQETQEVPTGVRAISAHISRMSFNAPLVRDVEMIEAMREASSGWLSPKGRAQSVTKHRFHMIDAGPYTAELSDDSKMKPDLELLTHLHGAGRKETETWLRKHGKSVGKIATADLAQLILGSKGGVAAETEKGAKVG
jgi:NTE family protein